MSNLEKDFMVVISIYRKNIEKTIFEEEWEALSRLLEARQKALEVFFSKLEAADNKDGAQGIIKKIQTDDVGFLSLIEGQKMKMKKQLAHLKKGKKSIKAYQV